MSARVLARLLGIAIAVAGPVLIMVGIRWDMAAHACNSPLADRTTCGPGDLLVQVGFYAVPLGLVVVAFLPSALERVFRRRSLRVRSEPRLHGRGGADDAESRADDIRRCGLGALATVLDIGELVEQEHDLPLVQLHVHVEPTGRTSPYKAKLTVHVSLLQLPRPGDRVAVRYLPDQPSQIVLATGVIYPVPEGRTAVVETGSGGADQGNLAGAAARFGRVPPAAAGANDSLERRDHLTVAARPMAEECPNCGAPLELDEVGRCRWCRAHIRVDPPSGEANGSSRR